MSSEQTRAEWQSEPCPPWCIRAHHDDDPPDDRFHDSATTQVPVIFAVRDHDAGPGRYTHEPGQVSIVTSRHVDSDDVVVFIGCEDNADQQLNLTVESSARLAGSIARHLDANG